MFLTHRVDQPRLSAGVTHLAVIAYLSSTFVACISVASAGALESSDNFIVLVADDTEPGFAQQVLDRAEEYRQDIAIEWLGEALPPSVGRAIVNVKLAMETDKGLTWAIDDPRRTHHAVYLTTSSENALGKTLQHEMAHVVFATQFPYPNRLPPWLEEGIASRYDDDERQGTRDQILGWTARTGNWPDLLRVLESSTISTNDQLSYAVASSLVDYLLTQGEKENLFRFAVSGQRIGWDRALNRNYAFENVDQLRSAWQDWVSQKHVLALAQRPR